MVVGEDEEGGRRVGEKEFGVGQGRDTMGEKERTFRVGAAGMVLLVSCVLCVALSRNGGVAVLESVHARALTPQQLQILDKEADSQDQKFQDHVSRQIKQLMKRAKTEETNADKEDQKGLQLDAKAKHTCKIADYLQNTDDGLEARARTQREAATSLEGNAAVMIAQANKEQQLFEDLHTKGSKLRASGQKLLSIGTELVSHAAALNATAHAHEKAKVTQDGSDKEVQGGEIVAKAIKILDQAKQHRSNADMLRAKAHQTSKAADAVMALGEKFERRAVSHRLKTMTYRSKCTMMKAKAEAALRKGQDEAQNALALHKIIKPAAIGTGTAVTTPH